MTVSRGAEISAAPAARARFHARTAAGPKPIDSADGSLRRAVLARLIADPLVSAGHIGAVAKAGIVTLSGYVTSNRQKDAASAATRCVKGVKRVADDVRVAVPCTAPDDPAPEPIDVRSPTAGPRPSAASA
jgi:osmotically-inducible protein OsmY